MKKFLALILSVLMICSALTACSSKDSKSDESETTTTATQEKAKNLSVNSQLVAKKLKSLEQKDKSFTLCDGGIIYRGDSGKYGIISLDGENDTGEKYIYCKSEGNLFEVASSKAEGDGIAAVNCLGLVDGNGNTVLEEKYAACSEINNRYYRVCEVTETTNKKDEALVFGTEGFLKIMPDETDTLYKGNWYILDVKTNSLVDGATGTKAYMPKPYGNYLECYSDNQTAFYVNGDGKKLPENAKLNADGTYQVEVNGAEKGEVYDNEDNLLFTYIHHNDTETNYIRSANSAKNYFICQNEKDGVQHYYVVDASGKAVSSNFSQSIQVYGELILSEKKLYNFKGEQVIEGEYSSVQVDDTFENYYILTSESNSKLKTVIDKEGTVIVKEGEDISSDFPLRKSQKDGGSYYLCYKDKDFTLKADSHSDWIVSVEGENGQQTLVNCLSGDKVIEGGYKSFAITGNIANGIYVLAFGENTADIYLVEAQ
ncbi:MAG: hypothetical protein IKE65_05560 [Clostridia bacterium]|nr:hypothetical protein [Clostridia bacterium]